MKLPHQLTVVGLAGDSKQTAKSPQVKENLHLVNLHQVDLHA